MDKLRSSRLLAMVCAVAFTSSFSLHTQAVTNQRVQKLNERMKLMAEIYELSVRHYKQHEDANRFLWAVEHLLDTDVVAATSVVLSHNKQVLPTVDFFQEESSYRINSADGRDIAIRAINIEEGFYEVQGQEFQWHKKQTFQENLIRLQSHFSSYSAIEFDPEELMAALNKIIPEAHASRGTTYLHPGGSKNRPAFKNRGGHGDGHGGKEQGQEKNVPGDGKGVVEDKPKDSIADQQRKAKKRCEREGVKNPKRCKALGLIGIIAAVVIGALLISKLTGDDDEDRQIAQRPDPKPLKPWVDARDGLTNAVANPGGSAPPAPPAGYEVVT